MFKRAAAGLSRFPKEGDQVEVTGRLDVYAPRGDLQLVVETLETAGQGDLYEQFFARQSETSGNGTVRLEPQAGSAALSKAHRGCDVIGGGSVT